MNALFNRLLGVSDLKLGDSGVVIDWARPVPSWGWLLIVVGAVSVSWWSYSRLDGTRSVRLLLAGIRAGLLALLAVLISGPQLSQQTQSVERDWVVIMADRSASMGIADVALPAGGSITRDQQLAQGLDAAGDALQNMGADRNVMWLGFDAGAFELAGVAPTGRPVLPAPGGRRTRLSQAIEQAARLVAARPVAGLVVLSDGRTSSPPDKELFDLLKSRQIPVFAVPLGSQTPPVDYAIVRAQAPTAAFARDSAPALVRVSKSPGASGEGVRIQLVDQASGRVLDEQPVSWEFAAPDAATSETDVTLTAKPDAAGDVVWVVRVIPTTPDVSPGNDSSELRIRIVDRQVRVVYFDGYPRWEYRYLKNLLLRESTIRSSALLLASQRKFIQEGSDPLLTMPREREEWRAYDVIILGDIKPEMFSTEQLERIKEHVANDGAGLLWIAGPSSTPSAWRATPLAELLPFSLAAKDAGEGGGGGGGLGGGAPEIQAWLEPVVMRPTPAAERLGVLRLGESAQDPWPAILSDPASGWSTFRYAQKIAPARVKPAVEILALAVPGSESSQEPAPSATPLVLTMRYGAGRSIYVATDETWRWRYGRGETLPERFWLPMIRMLARQGLAASNQAAVLEASPDRASVGQPVQVTVRLLDQSVLDARPKSIEARVSPKPRPGDSLAPGTSPVELRLVPAQADASDSRPPSVFSAIWIPTEPGNYSVAVTATLLAQTDLRVDVDVLFSDDELRDPRTDHALLAKLASETSGQVVPLTRLGELPGMLPNREIRLLGTPRTESLWDKPMVWMLLVTLLGLEWVIRRLIRLA